MSLGTPSSVFAWAQQQGNSADAHLLLNENQQSSQISTITTNTVAQIVSDDPHTSRGRQDMRKRRINELQERKDKARIAYQIAKHTGVKEKIAATKKQVDLIR